MLCFTPPAFELAPGWSFVGRAFSPSDGALVFTDCSRILVTSSLLFWLSILLALLLLTRCFPDERCQDYPHTPISAVLRVPSS